MGFGLRIPGLKSKGLALKLRTRSRKFKDPELKLGPEPKIRDLGLKLRTRRRPPESQFAYPGAKEEELPESQFAYPGAREGGPAGEPVDKEGGPAGEPVRLYWRQRRRTCRKASQNGRRAAPPRKPLAVPKLHFGSRHRKCCHFLVFGQTTACQTILSPFDKAVGGSTTLNPTFPQTI